MPQDSFTETTHESWFSRIGGAFKGILVGLVLFLIAFPLLFWNEGRAVKRYKTLKEGGSAVVSVAADSVSPDHAGKLVHVTGKAETEATLTDSTFGISANALKLKRVVDMYQWEETAKSETKKELGGGTETVKTYTYKKVWSEEPIQSSDFKESAGHQNPDSFPFESAEQVAGAITLGAFTLSPSLVDMIDNYEALPVESGASLPEALTNTARLSEAGFFIGTNPAAPQVGDVRVRFKVARPSEISVIAKQAGNTFEPYGTKAGGTIELLQMGNQSAEAMIQQAQASNKLLAWILRLVGFFLMLIGLNLMLKPLSVLADVLPILGTLVSAGTGVLSFLVSACLSLITMAIAWIFYRPLLGIILIAIAVVLVLGIKGKLKPVKKPA
jgi:hypothetical protein